jgi:hypothetical protein
MRIRSLGLRPGINPGCFLSLLRHFVCDLAIGKSLRANRNGPGIDASAVFRSWFAFMLFGTYRLDCRQFRNSVYLSQKLGEQRWK